MVTLTLVFIVNIYLSLSAFLDEFKGIKMWAFQRLHWMLTLLIVSLLSNYYQVTHNVETILMAGGFGGIVLFAITTISQILVYSLFFMICLKNLIVGSYYLIAGLDTGPKQHEKIDTYIEKGELNKALSSLIWLERQYPTNLYVNEKLLHIYMLQYNKNRALDKVNCLCRFHSDHENFQNWIEKAIEIDATAGLHIKKTYTSESSHSSSDLT